jgi:hypothetical protein
MSITLLPKVGTVQLNASGAGTVTLRPDVGQYWVPTLVRVATRNSNSPKPYCAVYQGSLTLTQIGDTSAFLDDTFSGNSDVSSIISGTVTQYGEAITAIWSGGIPGDIATLTVSGVTTDVPPTLENILPLVPGTHFAGKPSAGASVLFNDTATISAAKTYPLNYVGNLNSFIVWSNPTGHGLKVELKFYGDAAGTILLDTYQIDMLAGDTCRQPVPILGPYLKVVATPSAASTTFTLRVWATPERGIFDGMPIVLNEPGAINAAIGANTTAILDSVEVLSGPATWEGFVSGGSYTASLEAVAFDGTTIQVLDVITSVGANLDRRLVYLPPAHIHIKLVNLLASAQAFNAQLTRDRGSL